MPRSDIIYTSQEGFLRLKEEVFANLDPATAGVRTISAPQRSESGMVRIRITDLATEEMHPFLCSSDTYGMTVLTSADRDVRQRTYAEILEDADRSLRVATLQLVSPMIIPILGSPTPFPAVPFLLTHYMEKWNLFSRIPLETGRGLLSHVHITDFKLSCAPTAYGPGAQGWVTLEAEKGRTEEELRLFNALLDFAFFSGTGLHTDEGLGQTRRLEPKGRP
jgi:hypothetical protein